MDGLPELFVSHLGEEVLPKLPHGEQAAVAESFFVVDFSASSHILLHTGFVYGPPQHVEGLVADAVDFHGV